MARVAEIKATINYEFVEQALRGSMRYLILEGSTRSSKTWSIAQAVLLFLHNNPGKIVTCFRKEEKNHTTTTIETVKAVLASFRKVKFRMKYQWNKQEKIYRFENGSVLRFIGTLDPGKLHGAESDIAWLNEVMEIGYDAYKQISQRTKGQIIFDFNPSLNQHWLFSKIMTQTDRVAYRHSTFEDNPFLTDAQRADIYQYDPSDPVNVATNTANQWHWDVYGLGKRGRVEGVIFPKWSICEEMPPDNICLRHGGGMDFGFHPDPSTLIECKLHNDTLYLKEKMYEPGLLVTKNQADPMAPSIQLRLEEMGWDKELKIYADSAQPGSIQDLRISGYNMQSAIKGKDSIVFGINIVNQFRIKVHQDSLNLQMELEQYRWKKGPTGDFIMGKPIDKFNHCFVAGTEVTTRRGQVPIEQLLDTDEVLTRAGYRKMRWHGYTRTTEIWRAEFSDGSNLYGSGNHRIFTNRGDIPLDSLRYGDIVHTTQKEVLCQTQPKSMPEVCTPCTPEKSTTPEDVTGCTKSSGKMPTDQSHTGSVSTTKTSTLRTMLSRIWNALLGKNMEKDTEADVPKPCETILTKSDHLRKSGIVPRKGWSGTGNKRPSLTRSESQRTTLAKYVKIGSTLRNWVPSDSAQTIAKPNGGETLAWTMETEPANTAEKPTESTSTTNKDSVHVIAVSYLGVSAPVYNLETTGPHEYYANGVLVHNCLDPLRYWTRSEAIFCRQASMDQKAARTQLLPRSRKPSVPSQRIKH